MSDIYDCVQIRFVIIKSISCIMSYCNFTDTEEVVRSV